MSTAMNTIESLFLRSVRTLAFVILCPFLSPFLLIAGLCWICYWMTSDRGREAEAKLDGAYRDLKGVAGYAYSI